MGREIHRERCVQAQAMQDAEFDGADLDWPDGGDEHDPWTHFDMGHDGERRLAPAERPDPEVAHARAALEQRTLRRARSERPPPPSMRATPPTTTSASSPSAARQLVTPLSCSSPASSSRLPSVLAMGPMTTNLRNWSPKMAFPGYLWGQGEANVPEWQFSTTFREDIVF